MKSSKRFWRERTIKTRAKVNPEKAVREVSIIFRFESRKSAKCNSRKTRRLWSMGLYLCKHDWTLTGRLESGLPFGVWARLWNGILTPNSASMHQGVTVEWTSANVLQTARVHWWEPVLLNYQWEQSLVIWAWRRGLAWLRLVLLSFLVTLVVSSLLRSDLQF